MNDLQPLMALLAQTEKERDLALVHSQRQADAHRAAQQQAEQLRVYRSDYERRWGEQFGREGKVELLRCYQGFVERLSMALEQQVRIAHDAAQQAERAAGALREYEIRVASVRKLIERRVTEVQRTLNLREQKQSDEFASRAARQRLSNFGSLSAR
jgi:flagellar protein FliJ